MEEGYTELNSLLQDLVGQQSDADIESENTTVVERKKREELLICNQALLTLKEKQTAADFIAATPSSVTSKTPEIRSTPMPPPAKRSLLDLTTSSKSAGNELLEYMRVRDERNAE